MSQCQAEVAAGTRRLVVPEAVPAEFTQWLHAAFAVRTGCRDATLVNRALVALSRLGAVLEAQRLVCASALTAVSLRPDTDLAATLGSGRRDAARTLQRAEVTQRAPDLGEALSAGAVTAGHVDELGGALQRLDTGQQDRLLEQLPHLVGVASRVTADQFGRRLRDLERTLREDQGEERFRQQCRAVRLTSWVGREDGMSYWRLVVDPATAIRLDGCIRRATEAMFHGGRVPEGAPQDPQQRYSFARAHAMIGLIQGPGSAGDDGSGNSGRTGRAEYVIVEDRRVPAGTEPVIDVGLEVDLPPSVLARLRADADRHTIVLDGPEIVSAPGRLDRGRESRLATAHQRRVLRAWYATCAADGCRTRFDHCTIHHVTWWRHGGGTDLANLVPLCSRHHHQVHADGWHAELGPGRQLRIRAPDGRITAGGPNRQAAIAGR